MAHVETHAAEGTVDDRPKLLYGLNIMMLKPDDAPSTLATVSQDTAAGEVD